MFGYCREMRVLSEPSSGDIGWKKYLIASWAFAECLLFGGLLYGWAALVFVLKEEGVYANLCPDSEFCGNSSNVTDNTSSYEILCAPSFNFSNSKDSLRDENKKVTVREERCLLQDEKMALCFTIASAIVCAGCAVIGHANYKFGTRVTRIIVFLFFVGGSLMLAFVDDGLSTISAGGLSLFATNVQVANLFESGSSTVVSILSGCFDTSSAVQLIVKLAHQSGFARRNMYFVITGFHSMTLVSTFGFLPNTIIPRLSSSYVSKGVVIDKGHDTDGKQHTDLECSIKAPPESSNPSLSSCLKDPLYMTHIIWECVTQLRFFYFIGSLNTYLNRILDGDEEQVSHFTDVCFYTLMGGLVSSLLSGLVYDWQKKVCQKAQTRMYRELMPAVLPLSITCILSVILSLLALIPVRDLLYIMYIVLTAYRSFIYSMSAAFISAVFPSEYFAPLYGIMVIIGGMFSFLQFAFFSWSEAYPEAPLHVDICLLVLVLLSFIHPLLIWFKCWRRERKFK